MEAKVIWHDDMSFTGSSDTGFTLPLDAASAVGGHDSGFRPTELLAIGLAGCTAMDVISILKKKQQDITAFEVQTHIQRASEHPKVFTHIEIEYIVTGRDIDPAAVERSVQLSEDRYCPSIAMLRKAVEITSRITIKHTD
jgi:putative redox protein